MVVSLVKATILTIILFIHCSCLDDQQADKSNRTDAINSEITQHKIKLKLNLTDAMSHGWGHAYSGRVTEVVSGNFSDSVVNLHTSVSDFEEKFSDVITNTSENQVVAEFNLIENDKPYVNGKNAFIDQRGRTWELSSIRSVNKN